MSQPHLGIRFGAWTVFVPRERLGIRVKSYVRTSSRVPRSGRNIPTNRELVPGTCEQVPWQDCQIPASGYQVPCTSQQVIMVRGLGTRTALKGKISWLGTGWPVWLQTWVWLSQFHNHAHLPSPFCAPYCHQPWKNWARSGTPEIQVNPTQVGD